MTTVNPPNSHSRGTRRRVLPEASTCSPQIETVQSPSQVQVADRLPIAAYSPFSLRFTIHNPSGVLLHASQHLIASFVFLLLPFRVINPRLKESPEARQPKHSLAKSRQCAQNPSSKKTAFCPFHESTNAKDEERKQPQQATTYLQTFDEISQRDFVSAGGQSLVFRQNWRIARSRPLRAGGLHHCVS